MCGTFPGPHPLDGARVSNILPALADELGLDETEGVVVLSIRNGSVAQSLGFRKGDIILDVGDEHITTVVDLEKAVANRRRAWAVSVKRGAESAAAPGSGLTAVARWIQFSNPARSTSSSSLRQASCWGRSASLCSCRPSVPPLPR